MWSPIALFQIENVHVFVYVMGMGLRLLYNQIIRNFQDTLLSVEMDSAEKQQNISPSPQFLFHLFNVIVTCRFFF